LFLRWRRLATPESPRTAAGPIHIDVLLDDRDERPGVKFKDADLVGIPYRINVGKKLAEGQVEVFTRSTSTKVDVAVDAVVRYIEKKLACE
jgi:prolyl-tRNA synthetase